MTDTPRDTPENHETDENIGSDKPYHRAHSGDFKARMQSGGGMSLSRLEEIQDAEDRGEPLDLSNEERAEYEATRARIAQTMASFQRTMMEPYQAINARLQEIVRGAIRPIKFDMSPTRLPDGLIPRHHDLANLSALHVPELPGPTPIVTDDDLEAMADASRERDEVQTSIRKHTFETAAAMKAMLDEMERESKKGTTRWWWVFAVSVLTMLLAGVAALPIIGPFFGWW